MVEFRKLISFGKTSYVLSLPKEWVLKNKLNKGDLITIDEDEGNLVLSSKTTEKKAEPKETSMEIDGKNIIQIKREIVQAYVNNFNILRISGEELKDKAKDVRDILQNLMALEIMEQTAKKIVVKDFMDMDRISIRNLIRRIDIITRAMMIDSKNTLKEDNYDSICHRDEDVNRLTFLVFRAVRYALESPTGLKAYGMSIFDLLRHWEMASSLEKIADGTKRIARNFKKMKIGPNLAKQIADLCSETEKKYLGTMKAYYNNDIELIFKISDNTRPLLERCNKFIEKNRDKYLIENTMENLKQMIVHTNDIARFIWL
ncbi:phosphate uptake regulator PhoU [Candidatus Woesearchaeota archaeon]|nr:phosphate uptake regulator PhoU [Candidatus Woesearchaeota archaeon]